MALYSKKVMEHFLKPRNLGKLKNPDGIGKAGNPVCGDVMYLYIKVGKRKKKVKGKVIEEEYIKDIKFGTLGCVPENEKVCIGGKWEKIKNLKEGMYVLTHLGKYSKIKKIYKRKFSGYLVKITPFVSRFNSFYTTFNHPILAVKRKFLTSARKSSNLCKWLRIDEKELISMKPLWVDAELLEEGDYIVFVKNKIIKDDKKFSIHVMRLLGYYLAEGYLTANNTVINFSFNKNEKENIREVVELIKQIMNKEPSVRIRKNVAEIRVCSAKWARFLLKFCGKYANQKKLAETIMLLPFEKQWEMIKTYLKGDGNKYKRRPSESYTYRLFTSSKQLAIQFQEILARGGIFSSIKVDKRKRNIIEGRKIKYSWLYILSFKLKRKHKFVKQNENYLYVPIKEISKVKYKGNIYNLEVEKSSSYLVKGFAVHNCAAAIAVSSMLTEMVKGKSLEEAKKIRNEDIVKALGGLPNVKFHCSVLGREALLKAIEDYEKRRSRKKVKK